MPSCFREAHIVVSRPRSSVFLGRDLLSWTQQKPGDTSTGRRGRPRPSKIERPPRECSEWRAGTRENRLRNVRGFRLSSCEEMMKELHVHSLPLPESFPAFPATTHLKVYMLNLSLAKTNVNCNMLCNIACRIKHNILHNSTLRIMVTVYMCHLIIAHSYIILHQCHAIWSVVYNVVSNKTCSTVHIYPDTSYIVTNYLAKALSMPSGVEDH